MVTLKITSFFAQSHVVTAAVEANEAPHPPPIENDLTLVIYMFLFVQEYLAPLKVEREMFQALSFSQPLQHFFLGQPSQNSFFQLLIPGQEMLLNIQQLQANLGV